VGCEAQLAQLRMPLIDAHFFRPAILIREVGQIDLVFVCYQGLLVDLCKQNYKSVCSG